MFDFGFGELLLIAVVALVVLGPERLPKIARLAGLWARKARAQWNAVKAELENEIADEELRRSIRETSDAVRDGMQQMRALPETLRNDPLVTDTAAVMTSPAFNQHAPHQPATSGAPIAIATTSPANVQHEAANSAAGNPAPAQSDDDPAQMSLFDADPQMRLPLPASERHFDV